MFLPLATFERGVCVGGGVGEAVGPEQLSSPAGKGSTHPLVLVLQLSFARVSYLGWKFVLEGSEVDF